MHGYRFMSVISPVKRTIIMTWQPNSWRSFPIRQVPEYPDLDRLNAVEKIIATRPPLVFAGEAQIT